MTTDTIVHDLSLRHGPVTDLFPPPSSSAEWDRLRLSDQQLAFYHDHGYLAGVRMLDNRQMEVLREQLNRLMDPKHPAQQLFYER